MQLNTVDNQEVRFAIVGFGFIGQRYARMIASNPFSKLVAIADTQAGITLSENFQQLPIFNSLEDLLSSDIKVDAVIISSPNGYHYQQALDALAYEKHVIIEKPLALSSSNVETIAQKASEKSLHVFSVVPNRNASSAKWLKKLVSTGILGKVFLVQINCFWNRDERYYNNQWRGKKDLDGGPLFTQFYHFIDLLYWLLGDIVNIHAKFADFNHQQLTETEDSGFIQFDFERGGMGQLNYSTSVWDQNLESSITILSENGSIKIGGQYMEKIEVCHIKDYVFTEECLPKASTALQNHQQLLNELVDVIRKDTPDATTLDDAKRVIDIITRIYSKRHISKCL